MCDKRDMIADGHTEGVDNSRALLQLMNGLFANAVQSTGKNQIGRKTLSKE